MALTVTHRFTSAKSEQTDPTLIGPNEWNATHSTIDTSKVYWSVDYDFAAITPGGSLVGGGSSNTITLSPFPAGLAIGGYLYVSGGTGAAESCPITGVTLTTVTITCQNAHTGAWSIKSSTAGIQEAYSVAGVGGYIRIPNGSYAIANLNIGQACLIQGAGEELTIFTPLVAVTTMITVNPAVQVDGLELAGFTIDLTSQPTMNGIDLSNLIHAKIHDIRVISGYDGFRIGLTSVPAFIQYSYFHDLRLLNQSNHAISHNGEGAGENWFDDIDIQITGANSMVAGFYAFRTTSNDYGGIYFRRLRVTSISTGTVTNGLIFDSSVAVGAFIWLDDCIFDAIGKTLTGSTGLGSCLFFRNAFYVTVTESWFTSYNYNSGAIYIVGGGNFLFANNDTILAATGDTKGMGFNFDATIRATNIVFVGNIFGTGSLSSILSLPSTNTPTAVQFGINFTDGLPIVPSGQEAYLASALGGNWANVSGPLQVFTSPTGGPDASLNIYDMLNNVNHPVRNNNGTIQDLNSTNTTIIRTLDNSGNHSIVGYNLCGNSNFSAAPSPVGIRGALFTINDCTVTTGTVSGGGGGHANLVVSDNTNWKVLFNFT